MKQQPDNVQPYDSANPTIVQDLGDNVIQAKGDSFTRSCVVHYTGITHVTQLCGQRNKYRGEHDSYACPAVQLPEDVNTEQDKYAKEVIFIDDIKHTWTRAQAKNVQ